MARLSIYALIFAVVAIVTLFRWDAMAAPPVFHVSMRSLSTEATPSFVLVVKTSTTERAMSVAGCDGTTYYATAADAEAIAAALANGEVVHLHRGSVGQAPETTSIKCRFT